MKKHVLIAVGFLLTIQLGCREKIIHEIGITQLVDEPSGPINKDAKWQLLDDSPTNIYAVESFEGTLYLGGMDPDEDDAYLFFYKDSTFTKHSGKFISGPISHMEIIGDRLWIGGGFSHYLGLKRSANLLYVKGGTIDGITFGDFLSSNILNMSAYQGNLMVNGYFHTGHDNIKTQNIEIVKGITISGFESGIGETVFDCAEFNGKLYACGEGQIAPGVHMCGYWENGKWNNSGTEKNSGILDYGWALETYKGNLYFTHNKDWATDNGYVRRFDGSKWYDVTEVDMSTTKRNYMKVINNELYLYGEGVVVNGELGSNIIKFNGTDWSQVGKMNRPVTDVTLHDNHLYAATSKGVYVLK